MQIANHVFLVTGGGSGLGSETAKIVFNTLYYVLPNLSHFTFATETSNGIAPPATMIAASAAYALVYDIILLTITIFVFSRRNFK